MYPFLNDRIRYETDRGRPWTTVEEAMNDILCRAWSFDDKPHQLFNILAKAAEQFAHPDYRDEIVRVMEEAMTRKVGSSAPPR